MCWGDSQWRKFEFLLKYRTVQMVDYFFTDLNNAGVKFYRCILCLCGRLINVFNFC